MTVNLAYLALGSNLEPERHLPEAVRRLAQVGQVRAASAVWETAPVGFADQPNFLNAALLLATPLGAQDLCTRIIPALEAALGRVRTQNKNGPRTIDVDLVLFNQEVLDLGHRHIPDPDIATRPFLAIPLAEIAPDYVHPETGETLRVMADRLAPVGMRHRADVRLEIVV
jgi:2-amino-4-hydroxy-6-hydroxymethyldihydropteridine diphosphokinase